MDNLAPIKGILPTEEFNKLKDIQDELKDAWHKNQVFRTETEARYSVLNDLKFPTKAAKYWQSVREQMVHFDELTRLSFEMRRKEIDLRECETDLENDELDWYALERRKIDHDELLFEIASMKRIAKDRVREVMQWSQIKQEVNDGSFDDQNVNTHQKESLFRSVMNRAQQADPNQLSTEERLSIKGIIDMLKDDPVNKQYFESLTQKEQK